MGIQTGRPARAEANEVGGAAAALPDRRFDAYLSSNRTCEIGLSRATGETYESVINALERATGP